MNDFKRSRTPMQTARIATQIEPPSAFSLCPEYQLSIDLTYFDPMHGQLPLFGSHRMDLNESHAMRQAVEFARLLLFPMNRSNELIGNCSERINEACNAYLLNQMVTTHDVPLTPAAVLNDCIDGLMASDPLPKLARWQKHEYFAVLTLSIVSNVIHMLHQDRRFHLNYQQNSFHKCGLKYVCMYQKLFNEAKEIASRHYQTWEMARREKNPNIDTVELMKIELFLPFMYGEYLERRKKWKARSAIEKFIKTLSKEQLSYLGPKEGDVFSTLKDMWTVETLTYPDWKKFALKGC